MEHGSAARTTQGDCEKDICMSPSLKHRKSQQESGWQDVQITNNVINQNINNEDYDINRQDSGKYRMREVIKEVINSFFAKVVNKLLSGEIPLSKFSLVIVNCLMVPGVGFKDLKDAGSEAGIDSGIHSNHGPVLLSQHSGELQVDSPPQNVDDSHGLDMQHAFIGNRPSLEGGSGAIAEIRNDAVEEEMVIKEYPTRRHVIQWQRIFDLLPQYFHDVRIGRNEDLIMFVKNIGTTPVGSGMFLKEYAPLYGFRGSKSSFNTGNDYRVLSQFQPGKMVYLNQCVTTEQLFVSKLVPIVQESLPAGLKYELQHKQQVELVVGEQDWCSGIAKIHGVIKRHHNDREFAEVFMEFCQGGTIHDNMVSLRSLTLMEKLRLAQNILDNVEYLHKQTIIHGDIKYANMAFRESLTDVALIDFESAKHPNYRINSRATYLFVPPWYEEVFRTQDFSLLKTLDMWSLGTVLLKIIFGQQLWGQENNQLQRCDSCNMREGTCLHLQAKFLCLIKRRYPHAIKAYLPDILPNDNPVWKRLACLMYGLLPQCGPNAQFTATQAKDALDECMVIVVLLKQGNPTVPPVVVEQGTTIRTFIQYPEIRKLKAQHLDLEDGLWLAEEYAAADGKVKERSVTKNHKLTESCVLHVYPPIGTV